MRPEDQLLFLITRQDFGESHQRAIQELLGHYPIHWDEVISIAEQHGVAPVVYVNLMQPLYLDSKVPLETINHCRLYLVRQVIETEKKIQKLIDALRYFQEMSIDVMLVKGVALSLFMYRFPWYTIAKDYDLILARKPQELSKGEISTIAQHFHQSGIEFDFYGHHDLNINGAIPVDFSRIWRDALKTEYRGQEFFIMSDEDLLISLCINSCRKRYFRLKSLFDIAEMIRTYHKLNWDIVVDKTKAYDCTHILYTALRVTQDTLGCELPPDFLTSLEISPSRVSLINSSIKYLLGHTSLSSYPYSGRNFFGRQFHLGLILPYLTYRGYQIQRKMREILVTYRER